MQFIPVSWIFSIITPIFSVTWFFRNHSNIAAQETFIIIINDNNNVENSCATSHFYENSEIFSWWIESSKEQYLFETEIFCNIINVFTVTFD